MGGSIHSLVLRSRGSAFSGRARNSMSHSAQKQRVGIGKLLAALRGMTVFLLIRAGSHNEIKAPTLVLYHPHHPARQNGAHNKECEALGPVLDHVARSLTLRY